MNSNTFICSSSFSPFNCFKTSLKTFRVFFLSKKYYFLSPACLLFLSLLYFFLSSFASSIICTDSNIYIFSSNFSCFNCIRTSLEASFAFKRKMIFFIKAAIFLLALSFLSLLSFFSLFMTVSCLSSLTVIWVSMSPVSFSPFLDLLSTKPDGYQ